MSKSKRYRADGYPEHQYAYIHAVGDEIVEETFWSPFRYPSHLSRFYVRTDDAENLAIKRAQVRRQIEDRKNETFLASLTPSETVTETTPPNVVPMAQKGRILQKYASRA